MLCGFVRHTVEQYIITSTATMTFIKNQPKNEVIIQFNLWCFVPQTIHLIFSVFLLLHVAFSDSLWLLRETTFQLACFSATTFLSTVVRSLQQQ